MVTKHKLSFEVAPWPRNPAIQLFRVGTCEGQWFSTNHAYCILSVKNSCPGNGHLDDVFEWFEASCFRDKKALIVLELINEQFKAHLLKKRGLNASTKTDILNTQKNLTSSVS